MRLLLDSSPEGVGAFAAHQAIRVFAFRQKQKTRAAAVLQVWQRRFQGAPGGLAAGCVTVEAEQYAGYDTKQPLEVLVASRCAQCRDGIAQPLLRQCNDVHVAFYDHDFIQVAIGFAGLVEPVKLLAFMKYRCFRRVQVFRLVIAQHTAAKGNDAPAAVADREHHPVTEAVIASAGFGVFDQQPGVNHCLLLKGVAAQVLHQIVPAGWGEAEAEIPCDNA